MKNYRFVFIALIIIALAVISASSTESFARGMIMGYGDRLSDPQIAIMKVQLGASTQSGVETLGESVKPYKVSQADEKAAYQGLLSEAQMGPTGVSGVFIRLVDSNTGIWVASSNNDYSPLVYANAFYTAGIRDVVMSVSSIEPVPGMMALGVALNAYEELTAASLPLADRRLAAKEMLATARLGKALEHYEMGAEVAAYAKDYCKVSGISDAQEISRILKDRVALYERQADEDAYLELATVIGEYVESSSNRSDMQLQLAALRADQLWLVEPKERMVDEETLAQADEELQKILDFLDRQQAEPGFFQKNAGWVMAAGLVLVSAVLAIAIAYFQTRPKGASKGKKR